MVNIIDCVQNVGAALAAILFKGFRFAAKAAPTFLAISSFSLSAFSLSSPNILFIFVDDLGWSDLKSYGHTWHETPRIDSLGTDGMRFTQAYASAPICSASRASILTGKTTARVGLEFVVKDKAGKQEIDPPQPLEAPPITLSLPLNETTIAEQLGSGGYETAYFGKWHLNPHYQGRYLAWSPTEGPGQQGFSVAEEDFGSHPYSKTELATLKEVGAYYPDGVTDRAIRFLKQDHDKPFFLMVSHFYVHTPVESPYAWLLEKYDKQIPEGIPNREQRVEYAAFVETLDHYVGQLLDGLDDAGVADNTLVVFFSDNGGHPEYVANGPLRGSKWNLYEGGIRVPMFVRWPGKVRPSSMCDVPVVGYDLFPTFSAVAGQKIKNQKDDLDGISLLPLFKNPQEQVNRAIYWHFPYYHPEGKKFGQAKPSIGINDFVISQTRPQSAIRKGDYKLLYFEEDQRTELYDLGKDLSEQKDLSQDFPGVTKDLKTNLLQYLDQVHARRAVPKS
jgi:arylsulfatase A